MTTILIVDDSTTDRVRISGLLKSRNDWTIKTASNGKEALEMIGQEHVDVVLTDLQMPEMNGQELLKHVCEEFPAIPVIAITGVGSEELAVSVMKAGAANYVCKTDPPGQIRDAIDKVLAAKGDKLAHQSVMSRMLADSYCFSLENESSLMSALSRFLGSKANSIGVCSESEMPRLIIALEEALLNACLHGNLELESSLKEEDGDQFEQLARKRASEAPWMDRRVTVQADFSPYEMRVCIKDEGNGFDPSNLPDPTDPENLLKPHGRGVMMMRLFLNEVFWNETGNEVTLVKKASES